MGDKREEFLNELDIFLTVVKDNGVKAIAFCSEEEERMRLLGFMQNITRQEIKLKQIFKAYDDENNLELIADGEELDLETIAQGDAMLQAVKVDKTDG
tara:strand:+ start:3684 stop:3977 length:294 start_codon:yes stop_codon:yes gene_type:complete